MREYVMCAVEMNGEYAKMHLADIPAEQWTVQPEGVSMHPASIVAHLVVCNDFIQAGAGGRPMLPEAWAKFADSPDAAAEPSDYPSKDELMSAFESTRARLIEILEQATPEQLAEATDEKMREIIPTQGALLVMSLTIHDGIHLGQLSAWRKAMGLPMHI